MAPRRPRPDLREGKAKAIVEAAASVFAERGLRLTRMADVADRAKVGKGTLYEYFESKEELFLAVFNAYSRGTLDAAMLEVAQPPVSAARFITDLTQAVLAGCAEILYLYPLTMEFWAAATAPEFRDHLKGEFRELYAGFRAVYAEAIRKGIAAGEFADNVDPEHTAAAVVGALDALFLQAWFDPAFDPKAAGTHFIELLLRGMAAAPTSTTAEAPAPRVGRVRASKTRRLS